MFGRWKKKEQHRANKQQGDPSALGSEGESWLFAVVLLVSLAAATAFLGVIVVTLAITTVASLYKTRVHDVKKEALDSA